MSLWGDSLQTIQRPAHISHLSHKNSAARQDKSSWLSVWELHRLCNGTKAKSQSGLNSKVFTEPDQSPRSQRCSNTYLPLAHQPTIYTPRVQHLLNCRSWSADSATCDFSGSWIKHSKIQVDLLLNFLKYWHSLCYFNHKQVALIAILLLLYMPLLHNSKLQEFALAVPKLVKTKWHWKEDKLHPKWIFREL